MAGKEENKKLEEYENENYYLLWWALHYSTRYTHMVTHPNTNPNKEDLTLLSGRNMLLSLWYSNSTLNVFFKCGFLPMITVHQGNGILAP